MIRIPDFLQKGDLVAIVSPSGPIDSLYIEQAKITLESWGLRVYIGNNAVKRNGVFAGSDEERLSDFQNVLDSEEIKAIFCSRGGYGGIRIVEKINYSKFIAKPKWIIGFSDITVFHSKISKFSIASLHAAMPKNFNGITEQSLQSLRLVLFGIVDPVCWSSSKFNKNGVASGKVIGGNLSMLYSIRGLELEYSYKDCILFIEDLNEYLYHIDRIMQNLQLSGILSQISGLLVGSMSEMKNGVDAYGGSIESIILDAVSKYSYPVAFNFPSGHEKDNMPIILGGTYTLQVEEDCKFLPHLV